MAKLEIEPYARRSSVRAWIGLVARLDSSAARGVAARRTSSAGLSLLSNDIHTAKPKESYIRSSIA